MSSTLLKKLFVILLALALVALFGWGCDAGAGSTGGVCTDDISGIDRTSEAKLYYPCDISSKTGATTMSGGYTGTLASVDWLSRDIAKAGFIVLAFTPSNTLGYVEQWMNAHKNCIVKLKALNNSHRAVKGMIDTGKLQACGHSKGGAGALWASSQLGSQLKATIAMAPWMEGFTAYTLKSISAATFVQAGSFDTLAISAMTKAEYYGVGASQKCYKEYPGYDHLAWVSAMRTRASLLSGDIIAWMNCYLNGKGRLPVGCPSGGGTRISSTSGCDD